MIRSIDIPLWVNEMLNRIMILVVVVSMAIALPDSAFTADFAEDTDLLEGFEGPLIMTGVVWAGMSLAVTMYNCSGLDAEDPSKLGGIGGLVLGSVTTVYGAGCLFFDDTAVKVTGGVCAAVGVFTVYCAVRTLKGVRRKYFERKEWGLTFAPVLMDDGAGRLGPGMQVSWSF